MLVAGLLTAGYFLFVFDPTLAAPGSALLGIPSERVNNIGLLADKQNGVIVGIALVFLSVGLLIWDSYARKN